MITGFVVAQNPYHITIDQSSGLPANAVYDIFQDKNGFMWFGTGKGLSRYDGNFTKTYTSDIQTAKSGSNIQQDKYGRIWYENFDGYLYYVQNQKLKTFKQNKPLGYFRYGVTDQTLQIIEKNGVQLYNLKTLNPEKKIKLDLNHISFIFSGNDKFYIFDKMLYEIDRHGNVKSYAYPEKFLEEFSAPIVQKKGDDLVIISKFSKKYCYFKNGKFILKKFDIPDLDFVQNIAVIKDNIWLCTTKGIVKFNSITGQYKTYFSTKNISFIYLDQQENYWISTLNEGVFFVGNFDSQIITLPYKPTVLANSKSHLYIATENDAIYSLMKNEPPKKIYTGKLNHDVYQIFADEKTNDVYFTSSIFQVNTAEKTTPINIGAVKAITKIDDKYFAYAASNISGVFGKNKNIESVWDDMFARFPKYEKDNYFSHGIIPNANGKSVAYNAENNIIYYGTNNGLITLSTTNKREIFYKNESLYLNKLHYFQGKVYAFSSNEKLYIINKSNNITLFSLKKLKIEKPIEKVVFQDNLLFAFTKDEIYEINLAKNKVKKIITLAKNINISDVRKCKGHYYLASADGIITLEENSPNTAAKVNLFLENISANDKNYDLSKKLAFDYQQNNIKIDFTILTSIPNEKFNIEYKINDAPWNVLKTDSQSLLLSALSPDDYEIHFRIADQKNPVVKTIQFEIKKPFWLNPLTLLAVGIILLSCVIFIYRRRLKTIEVNNAKLLHQLNLEKNVNQSKLKAIKSQMNPHFFYNALNTLQSYILANEKKQAIEYLSKFSNLTRTILEMTEKDEISVFEEIKALTLYLDIEKARFEDELSYTIITNSSSENDFLKIPSMLLQPFVENALKHGLLHKKGKKILKISFEKSNELLKITIDDNGIGRQKSGELNAIKNKNHVSFATKATQNRIDLLNQFNQKNIEIETIDKVENGQFLGTTIILTIPIKN
ncbi:sensor histidine kinase [Frigoriflavimonas asaccharolytica]|uniref:Signal transduction histidine kinase internal region domain-containing protein n=1 Tax=Frigoriflavimonas asaccharolytica TaxID=2735899 RepID=A0A8J8G5U8_9FLAO|nr:histidine kinase [Frigoriflavimonas asaccharolytica]NRS91280.1 hypothetical protein [Frigoriflavimonas asaccharolytica]